jgi:hypothetical protein
MRKRAVEVFYMQDGNWFYVGQFKGYPLPDMTKEEFAGLDVLVCRIIQFSLTRQATY